MTIAFTGHRPKDLPAEYGYDYSAKPWVDTIDAIKRYATTMGATKFIVGGAQGFDTAAGFAALQLKAKGYPLVLQMEIPFKRPEMSWGENAKHIYDYILKHADVVNYLFDEFKGKYVYQVRNQSMVDQADRVCAFWTGKQNGGTYNTIKYAQSKGKVVDNLYGRPKYSVSGENAG